MPVITSLMLRNFKKFDSLTLNFEPGRNVLIGDNESGKSSILLALDLVLSDSRHRVDALGVESLLSQNAVAVFQAGEPIYCRNSLQTSFSALAVILILTGARTSPKGMLTVSECTSPPC
jgi:DNA repair ATPase RecN